MKTGWHKYFIYFSLIFLIVVLYKAHYLEIPHIYSPVSLFLAFVCLLGGFMANTLAQQRLLQKFTFHISIRQALAMEGLNIFSKYLPGKVWMIMGKAMYLADKKKYPAGELSLLFLHVHVVALWCGLLLGICGLWMNDALHLLSWMGLGILGLFTLTLLSKTVYNAALGLVNKVLKKDYLLPDLDFSKSLFLIPWFLGVWILWGGGFFLFAISITNHVFPFSAIFCFPLAGTLGILFVFAPGGIGIREGIITGYLTLLNVSLPEAIMISASSRIWFLLGELFIFITGYLAGRK
jgi:uncharacterized membrane protein YbhN (UPF0104 family)